MTGRHDFETALRDEIASHLQHRIDDLVRGGMPVAEAHRLAHLEFGPVESYKERVRTARMLAGVRDLPEQIWRELRLGLRRLVATPLFALFAIATLAVSIGVTTAVYSVLYTTFQQSTGVDSSRHLMMLRETSRYDSVSWPDYQDLSAQQTSFASLAARAAFTTALVAPTGGELIRGDGVTGSYFATFGVRAKLGRAIGESDDRADAPPAAMISERVWRKAFASSPAVLGATVTIAKRLFTVVGVVPDQFRGQDVGLPGMPGVSAWVPLAFFPDTTGAGFLPADRVSRDRGWLAVVGQLKGGVTPDIAQRDVALIGRRIDQVSPLPSRVGTAAESRSWYLKDAFESRLSSAESDANRLILGLPMLVFLIACTNLANLMLSRSIARRHALAVRRALGCSRVRLVREEMTEVGIVATIGGMLGVIFCQFLISSSIGFLRPSLTALVPELLLEFRLRLVVLAFAMGGTLIAMVVAGLIPAWQAARVATRDVLASDSSTVSPRWRGRSNLIALQVSASVGLFLLAVVCVRFLTDPARLRQALHADHEIPGVAVAAVPFGLQQNTESHVRDIVDRVISSVGNTAGVGTVAATAGLPLTANLVPIYRSAWVATPERPFVNQATDESTSFATATPDLFGVLGMPLLFGREFDVRDTAFGERVAVVNEGVGLALFGTARCLDRRILVRVSPPGRRAPGEVREVRIVGVVPGGEADSRGRRALAVYLPFSQEYDANITFLARPAVPGAAPPVAVLERALRQADPDVAVRFIGPSDTLTAAPVVLLRFVVGMSVFLAALALVLAMTGLYGVLSHIVTHRTRELGLRMALGADGRHIVRMILREGFRPIVEGLAIGLLVAIVLRMLLQTTVVKTLPLIDPAAFFVAIVLLVTAGMGACYLPARRAARVDPNVALKEL